MSIQTIILILVTVFALLLAGFSVYLYLKYRTLDEIRADVYQLFLKAEHLYKESGTGKKKMKFVIMKARELLPKWSQTFITDAVLEHVIEIWFKAVKDLLDDGKFNKSQEEA
jgi:hypothetical protein